MKKYLIVSFFLFPTIFYSQEKNEEKKAKIYKKRILETAEIDLLTSFYIQDGSNAAVTGGIGTEKLNDFATNIIVSIPLNDNDVLSIDATVSAYTSASSSNLNPFTGASRGEDDDDDDDDEKITIKDQDKPVTGSPWVESSGASRQDVWVSGILGYSHSSDDRNNVYSANINFATEYDYTSFGGGFGYSRLFNQKNTEIGIKTNIFLDKWKPEYPTEIISYIKNDGNLNIGFFEDIDILDQNGIPIDKNGEYTWGIHNSTLVSDESRNTFSASLFFSQILSKRAQVSFFGDIILQKGWLSNPMQRVYFSDVDNFYIGNGSSIPFYTSPSNKDVFQLSDDIERLPSTRLKIPLGVRFNYFINEFVIVRTYYRYYYDDWGIDAHTANIEVPVKISDFITLYPSYRYYRQTAADYFAPYEKHISTETYYTSDYDLSKFNAQQYGFGIRYNDIFTKIKIGNIGFKTFDLNYGYYTRSTGLTSHIITIHIKMVLD